MKTPINFFIYLSLILSLSFNTTLSQENSIKDTTTSNSKPILYLYADKMPTFEGSNKKIKEFIDNNVKWPPEFCGNGTVIVSFVVKSDGNLFNIRIEKSLQFQVDSEAIRLIKSMPKWKPGELNGKSVDIIIYLPIRFVLH